MVDGLLDRAITALIDLYGYIICAIPRAIVDVLRICCCDGNA